MEQLQGTAFVFGDEINTTVITPHGSDYVGKQPEEILMHPIRPNFADEVTDGDMIVAGTHFGSGSSRESAPRAIKNAGIGAVVAESFARIYYRNSVNIGLPAITCANVTEHVSEGDELAFDFEKNVLRNLTTGSFLDCEPQDEAIQPIYEAGGLLEYYHKH